jgi:pimeloyl-ACP methyl ester carboxylesterase
MGGRVAARIWSVAPERVERFALLNTGHRAAVPGERERRYGLWQIARDKGMRAMAAEWLPALVPPERLNDREFMEPIYEMICRKTPEIFEAQIRALLNRADSEAVLRSVNVPSLVLAGRNDNTAPLAGHEEMAQLIAGAKLVVLECAHMAAMEKPAETTAALREWLAA